MAHACAEENVDQIDQGRVEDEPGAGYRIEVAGIRVSGFGFRGGDERGRDSFPGGPDALHGPPPVEGERPGFMV